MGGVFCFMISFTGYSTFYAAIQDILARLNASEGKVTLTKSEGGEDSDFDLFGSDDEEPSKVQDSPKSVPLKQISMHCVLLIFSMMVFCLEKPQPVAKSSLILDVKPVCLHVYMHNLCRVSLCTEVVSQSTYSATKSRVLCHSILV